MSKFLIGTTAVVGHVDPAIPIARRLVQQGHEVWWYTGNGFKQKIEATGAHHVPINLERGGDPTLPETISAEWTAKRESLQDLDRLKFDLKHGFVDAAVNQLQDLTDILQKFPADVLLCDVFFLGMSWLHEKTGLPWAAFGMSALLFNGKDTAPFGLGIQPAKSLWERLRIQGLNWLSKNVIMKEVTVYLDRKRQSVGLPAKKQDFFSAILSPFLYLQGTTPSFEYPRQSLPPQIHFTGTLVPSASPDFIPPSWWSDLKGDRPNVLVTQGTVATEASNLIIPTIEALAELEMLVVVVTGGRAIEDLDLNSIRANTRIETFIPYSHLLPHIDVMVTNGGFNGVQIALANGVPMVTAGQTEDKPEICARVEWSGVGINLKTNTPTPAQIRDGVKTVLASPNYQQNAEKIATEISSYNSPVIAVNLLEKLATTKQPVLRS